MSNEIIDKSLDEINANSTFINCIRINGGEPLLAQNQMTYLFDKIIDREIMLNEIHLFTNGLIKPTKDFLQSINRIINYLNNIELQNKKLYRVTNKTFTPVYNDCIPFKFIIIISDNNRDELTDNELQIIERNYNMFKHLQNDDFNIVRQSMTFKNNKIQYEIEGNALKNFKLLLDPNKEYILDDIRVIDNNYCFISKFINNYYGDMLKDALYFSKTISISSNGNVYPGCLTSYENVDNNPMFNILDCKNDFFNNIINWAWEHPVSEKMNAVRQLYLNYKFLKNNNYKIKSSFNFIRRLENYNRSIDEIEKIQKDIHTMLETLDITEIEVLALMIYVNKMFEFGIQKKVIHQFLHDCSNLTGEQIEIIDDQYCKKFILDYTNIDKQRKENEHE